MKALILSCLLLLVSTDVAPGGCRPPPPGEPTCADLSDRFDRAIESVGRSCDTVADCVLVGGAGRWCEAYPSLGARAGGRPVNASAFRDGPNASTFTELGEAFDTRCAGRSELCRNGEAICTWDAGPDLLACSNHVCVSTWRSCNEAPASDAGP